MSQIAGRYLNTVYLNESDFGDLKGSRGSFQPVFNAAFFKQLDFLRSKLDDDYFSLLEAHGRGERLKVRKRFFRFNDTLSTYIKKNRIELYDYLEQLYRSDRQKRLKVEANRAAMDSVVDTITATMVRYVSPSAVYDTKFRREMKSIWVLLKWRYQQEHEMLYPLYPSMLQSA